MSLSNARLFDRLVKDSPALQAQIEQIRSPIELIDLARAEGVELTGEDLREIAQTAYHTWVITLAPPMRSFFELAQHLNFCLNTVIPLLWRSFSRSYFLSQTPTAQAMLENISP